MIYSFKNDYSETCHPSILDAFSKLSTAQFDSYGNDCITSETKQLIKDIVKKQDIDVHFVVGGTLANKSSLSHILRPYEAVIATNFSHISTHETGAIEDTGHRIIEVEHNNGKLNSEQIVERYEWHINEHSVKPKLVYISNTTEVGSVYTYDELLDINKTCKKLDLYLYLDGARLGNSIAYKDANLSFEKIASLVDIFTIGGAKNGTMLGEAIVVVNNELQDYFRYNLKQKGAIVSKGWIVAIQFRELLKDDNLYLELAKHSNYMCKKISDKFESMGFELFSNTQSNQLFPILPNNLIEQISKYYSFEFWQKHTQTHSVVRFVCSWATEEKVVDEFIEFLEKLIVGN